MKVASREVETIEVLNYITFMGKTLNQTLSLKTFITSVVCGFRGSDIYSDIIFGI